MTPAPIRTRPGALLRWRTLAGVGARMMLHDKLKLLGTLAGVVFAVLLSNQQAGTFLGLIYKNEMYVLYDKGIFSRFKVDTGERVFRSRVAPGAAAFTASPWAYDGKIFLLSEEGNTFIVEAGEQYRLLGVNALDEFALATPAIVGDRLLIRTQGHLYSIRNRH